MTSFPQVWYTWFWTPLALAAHLAVFAKFLSARRQGWLRVAEA